MAAHERDLLLLAATKDLGIELESASFEADFAALQQERGKRPELRHLTIRRAQRSGAIWVIRTSEMPGEAKLPRGSLDELTLDDLGLLPNGPEA